MSLLNSISKTLTHNVLASNVTLAHTSAETLAKVGTSLPSIQNKTRKATLRSLRKATSDQGVLLPIREMRDVALSRGSQGKVDKKFVRNAVRRAIDRAQDRFETNVGSGKTILDLQNCLSESICSGISKLSDELFSIDPEIGELALKAANKGLVNNRASLDNAIISSLQVAQELAQQQASQITEQLLKVIERENLARPIKAEGEENGEGEGEDDGTAEGSSSTNTFGVWSGSEGEGPGGGSNTTDIVYQDIKLYIEGVQVPFEGISISQGIGSLPSAVIQLPPQAGLMDIARCYQPKVHIFFTDKNMGGDRLLFWGHIVACNYAKSRQQGMATISFRCVHKNALINQITLEWSNYILNALSSGGDTNPNQVASPGVGLNSKFSILTALQGITGLQQDPKDLITPTNPDLDEADVTKLDKRWQNVEKRLVGMPAVVINFWNQLKRACYRNKKLNMIMEKIYIPLMEEGLGFFDRLSGHYYLEQQIDGSRQKYCPEKNSPEELEETECMVPPAFRLPATTAISTTLAVEAISSELSFSGELAAFSQLFESFYSSVEYEVVTLASPAQVPADPTVTVDPDNPLSSTTIPMAAVETIVKPQIPFYFSPVCNLLLPKMYHTIDIQQEEDVVPTRITAFHDQFSTGLGMNYRGPNSIREAIAVGIGLLNEVNAQEDPQSKARDIDLNNTTGDHFNVPGRYEQGRGMIPRKVIMPQWLALLAAGRKADGNVTQEAFPEKGTQEYNDFLNLKAAWVNRYGYKLIEDDAIFMKGERDPTKDPLNPYDALAKVHPYERLLFSTVDYEFTKQVANSRTGMVAAVFNPYIVPGYPMDILSDSPNHPSFHALCSSVTHSISSRSIETTIGVLAATTYTELSNYYMQPLHPWLQTALKLIQVQWASDGQEQQTTETSQGDSAVTPGTEAPATTDTPPSSDADEFGDVSKAVSVQAGLMQNPKAKAVADEFYRSVFGVGSVAPDDVYDFSNGQVVPLARQSGILSIGTSAEVHGLNGGDLNDFNTVVGNLKLVSRPIEGRKAIEGKFGLKFIDLIPQNYNATGTFYQNPVLSADLLLEPGASLFLDYQDTRVLAGEVWSERKDAFPEYDNSAQEGETGGTPEQ